MASFSEGFSRGFSLVDKVMAREQEEERQKRLEAESKRGSLEREKQGRQGLALQKQGLKLKQEQQEWVHNVQFKTRTRLQERRLTQTDTSIDHAFQIANIKVGQSQEVIDNTEDQRNREWNQVTKNNAHRDNVFKDKQDQFRKTHGLSVDQFNEGKIRWGKEFDNNVQIQERIQKIAESKEYRTGIDWDTKNIRELLGTSLSAGQANANADDRADKLLKLKEEAAVLYMEEKIHNRSQDKILNEFTTRAFGLQVDQFKEQNSQFYATLKSSTEHRNRSLALQEAFIGVDGRIKEAQLANYLGEVQAKGLAMDETAKSLFLASTVVMDPATGGIKSVNIDTVGQAAMFEAATGIDLSQAVGEKQTYEAAFAEIDKGDFGSEGFKGAINHIYKNQINKPVGTLVQRDLYSNEPLGVNGNGEDKPAGWSLRPGGFGQGWSMMGSLSGPEENKNRGVNLKGGKIVGVEFAGIQQGPEGGQGGLNGVPMMKTSVLKGDQLYTYDSPMTKGRGTGSGDSVAPVSMQDFVKKTKGMEQVLTALRMSDKQRGDFDNSLQGADIGAQYAVNREKIQKAALMQAGYNPNGKSAKDLIDITKGKQAISAKGLKQMHAWLGGTGKNERYFNDAARTDDMLKIYGSLANVSDSLKRMNINPNWDEMGTSAQREILNAFFKQKAIWGDNSEDHADDAYLQSFVNLISKQEQGTLSGGGGLGGRRGPKKAFSFLGDWSHAPGSPFE